MLLEPLVISDSVSNSWNDQYYSVKAQQLIFQSQFQESIHTVIDSLSSPSSRDSKMPLKRSWDQLYDRWKFISFIIESESITDQGSTLMSRA